MPKGEELTELDKKVLSFQNRGCLVPSRDLIKTPEQVEGIRRSGVVNTGVLDLVAQEIHEGMTTLEIDQLVYDYTVGHGAIPAPLNYEGFPKSVCTSVNEVVCHGIPSESEVLKEGDIINVDVSTILDGYYSDASRMFVIGKTTPEKQKLVDVARECLEAGEPYPTLWQYRNHMFIWNVGAINAVIFSLWAFKSVTPLLVFYALMKGATSWLLYQIVRKTVHPKAAFIALVIYVLYPANYGESTAVLSEIPFQCAVMAGILSTLNQKPVAGGILIAAGNWFRPMGIVFLLSVCIFLWCGKKWKNSAKLIIGYLLFIGIIGTASWSRTGDFIFQSRAGWAMLMKHAWDNDKDQKADRKLFAHNDPMYDYGSSLNCAQKDSLFRHNFFVWLKHNPKEYFKQMPEKFIRTYISDNVNFCTFLSGKEEKDYMYEELSMKRLVADFPHLSKVQSLTLYNLFYYYMLIICFFMSCISLLKRRETQFVVLPISIVTIGTAVLLFFGHGEARFHIPFMPFIIMSVATWLSIRIKPKYNNNEEKISICHKQCP